MLVDEPLAHAVRNAILSPAPSSPLPCPGPGGGKVAAPAARARLRPSWVSRRGHVGARPPQQALLRALWRPQRRADD